METSVRKDALPHSYYYTINLSLLSSVSHSRHLSTALTMNKPVMISRRLYAKHPQLKFQTLRNNLFLTYKQARRSAARQVQIPEFRKKKRRWGRLSGKLILCYSKTLMTVLFLTPANVRLGPVIKPQARKSHTF